ncbi:hypothetical protein, partial [Azospirillum sp. A39]
TTVTALLLALATAGAAVAQTPAAPVFDPANPPKIDTAPLEPGATAFTEAQARRWLLRAGLSNIADLVLEEDGIWRGKAERSGIVVNIGLDRLGNITTR